MSAKKRYLYHYLLLEDYCFDPVVAPVDYVVFQLLLVLVFLIFLFLAPLFLLPFELPFLVQVIVLVLPLTSSYILLTLAVPLVIEPSGDLFQLIVDQVVREGLQDSVSLVLLLLFL